MGRADLFPFAIRWWKGFRPCGWSESDHLKNPDINVNGFAAQELARCVADCTKKTKKRRKVSPYLASGVQSILEEEDRRCLLLLDQKAREYKSKRRRSKDK